MLITGRTTTTVGHYKDAAQRHLHVCRILLEQLNDPKIIANVNKYQNVLAELYYLSGYIVECTINYKYLKSKNFLDFHNHYPNPNKNRRWDNGVDLHLHFRFIEPRALSSSKLILEIFPSNTLPDYLKNLGGIPIAQTLTGQDLIKEKMQKY